MNDGLPAQPTRWRHSSRWLLLCFVFLSLLAKGASPLQPDRLTCEYQENPLGLAEETPRFSWTLVASQRNQRQSAYEILVADNLAAIANGKGNVWESGKVSSGQTILVEYKGPSLKSFTRYYWRVRVSNGAGEVSGWSKPAWFETSMLQQTDWKARWIGDGRKQFERDEDFYGDDPMPLFRKPFRVQKNLAAARLYVSGLGYYEAYLNGKKIGDRVLDPGWTTYKKQVLYTTYDVTDEIQQGKNTIGFLLGNGWWNPLPLRLFGQFNLRDVQQTGRPCVKAQLLLRYTDGHEEWIATDESWQTTTGPVIRNNVYLGERYDARQEKESWAAGGEGMARWQPAVLVDGPSGELTPQLQPPVRVIAQVLPKTITEVGKDTFIVDLGQNFAGVVRISVSGPAGREVVLRYGEAIHPDRRLNVLTTTAGHIKEIWNLQGGPGAPKTAWQQDSYILNGKGREQWAPRFTFHGFRYVELTGWPGKPSFNDIVGLQMGTDVEPAGEFSCSNDFFNRLFGVVRQTFRSNLFSVQSDCPGREKMGYGADMVVTADAFSYNFDMANFYSKAVRDFANEQQPDGGITEIAPYTGIAARGYGGESGPLGWQLAYPFLQKTLYDFYGDKRIIEKNYIGIQKQLAFLKAKENNGQFYWDISDHESLDPKPEAFSASAFYYHIVSLAADFAGILNKAEDSVGYAKWAAQIKKTIVQKYAVPHTGRFDNGTQAAQLFALWYRFADDKEQAMNVLLQEIRRHNHHLSTGIFGTRFLLEVLRRENRNDVAYTIANQRTFPGWGYMLAEGASTLWESWEKPENSRSFNHPMFGSVSEWFFRSILGINGAAPAFQKITIKPQPAGDLTWAGGSYRSVQGTISCRWQKDKSGFTLQVEIPANTTAELWLPALSTDRLTESGKPLEAQHLSIAKFEDGYAVINLPSGTYSFHHD